MKKIYVAPVLELVYIASEDIMTASLMDTANDDFGTQIGEIKIG